MTMNEQIMTAEGNYQPENRAQLLRLVLPGCFAIVGLFIIGRHNYLLFHALVELGAVAVVWSVFFLVWNTRRLKTPPAFVMLGIGYMIVGALDLLHTLAYEGMGVFPGAGTNLATQLWIAARFIETAALLLFLLCFTAGGFCRWVGHAMTVPAVIMLCGIFVWDFFPECFNAETGLTTFKIASEYVIMGVLAGSVLLTYRKRKVIGTTVALFLSGAMLVTIVSEFCFTLYASPFGMANMIGHLLKVVSFMLIYRALIVESLERPMETLAQGLYKETERYAGIIETAMDGFWIVDMQGQICDVNASAERMTGLPRDTLLSMRLSDIESNESADEIDRHLKTVAEKGHDLFETRHRYKDGSLLDVEVSCSFLPYDNGQFIVFVRDISERKNAEDLVRASEERYRSFVQYTSEGVYLLMLDDPIDVSMPIDTQIDALYDRAYVAECNDAFAKMYGLKSGSELMNKTLIEFHGGKDHPVNRAEVRKFVESGYNVVDEETKETGTDGVMRWFSNATVGIVENGMLIRMWGTQTDITDRKKAARRVEESEARYRGIVSVLPDLLFRIDAELRFTDVQTSVPEMLLAPADEIVGKTAWKILPPNLARLTRKKVRATLESGKMQVYHYSLDMRGVTKECETRMVPCGNDEVLAIVRDITERKTLEQSLMKASEREQIHLAQELHDGLCQDLKGLEIQVALLEDEIVETNNDLKGLAADLSEGINLAVRRAYGITQSMFPIDLETRCFSEVLQDLAEKTALHRKTRLLISVQDDLSLPNQSRAHQLYRIAQEAMNNALQHSNATEIELIWREENGRKLLSVRDNGIGIGIKDLKDPGGLGLKVMSSRAQSINADLTVRNRKKCGTEILVRLKNE
jgi:PAS domain S-box-containing protein